MAQQNPSPGDIIPAPPELEGDLLRKQRDLRLVRIDTDEYNGWYVREVPDEEPALLLDGAERPLLYEMLEAALQRLRERDLPLYIESPG